MPHNIDIVDKHNQPTGEISTIDNALRKGLWHRGAHVVIVTKTGYVLVQKRSPKMITHPGFVDFSVAGFVDAGESPEAAALREIREEVGITVGEKNLQFAILAKYNHIWPRLRKKNRAFIYVYLVLLDNHDIPINPQRSEVEWARFMNIRQVRSLVRKHRLKSLGRLEPKYAFYGQLIILAQKYMSADVE